MGSPKYSRHCLPLHKQPQEHRKAKSQTAHLWIPILLCPDPIQRKATSCSISSVSAYLKCLPNTCPEQPIRQKTDCTCRPLADCDPKSDFINKFRLTSGMGLREG